jgi:hypothetical protein
MEATDMLLRIIGSAMAFVGVMMLAVPAHADWRYRHWHHYHGYRPGVWAPSYYYYGPPRVYYAPPPVMYAPPPRYYYPPAASFGVTIR